MAKKKIYAVKIGRTPGLYESWPEAERQVKGFAGARYKGFVERDEAAAWLAGEERGDAKYKERNIPSLHQEMSGNADALHLYTDGGALNNPGPGGYGVVVGEDEQEFSGGFRKTTNNRMELYAAIVALQAVANYSGTIVLTSDSSYLVNGMSKGWVQKWKKNGWVKSDNKAVLNQDLWEQLLQETSGRDIRFCWVKGHAGHPHNERCDRLAVQAARGSNLAVDRGYEEEEKRKG